HIPVLSSTQIETFFPTQYSDETHIAVCSVCLDDFGLCQKIRLLKCCHYFHVPCIDPWLYTNTTCPTCRMEI
ncbi:hypothetical protein COEREDRAFT_27481, partial [Coemansia reversa NRRL 1564]